MDWELTGDPRFKYTLEILLEAVKTDSLPFIYIYTHEKDLDEVVLNIRSYFSGNSKDELKKKYESLCAKLEDIPKVENADKLTRGMKEKCKEVVTHPDRARNIREDILNYFKEKLFKEENELKQLRIFYGKFLKIGKEVFKSKSADEFLKLLGLFLNNGYFRSEPVSDIDIRPIKGEEYAFFDVHR